MAGGKRFGPYLIPWSVLTKMHAARIEALESNTSPNAAAQRVILDYLLSSGQVGS